MKEVRVVSKNDFEFQYCVGKGGFGKVWKVLYKKTKMSFAIKKMSKNRILTSNGIKSVKKERNILANLSHPLISNIKFSFQDRHYLYLGLDYFEGGDLRYFISKRKIKFTENESRFIIACICLALKNIHVNNYIHRDVKPENLVFDKKGYLHLIDFGISRKFKLNNHSENSGTPCYMAPEVMFKKGHSFEVDFYAVGVILYEIMNGKRPYFGSSRKDIKDQLISRKTTVSHKKKKNWSKNSIIFCKQMMERKPKKRLGKKGFWEIEQHPWFKGFNWEGVHLKTTKPPFKPVLPANHYEKITKKYRSSIENNEFSFSNDELNSFADYDSPMNLSRNKLKVFEFSKPHKKAIYKEYLKSRTKSTICELPLEEEF